MNNNQKATKRALLTSVMALVMCVVMLVGTTFAWFTDTASTGVNKIVSGNLKVDIIGADNEDHVEKLNFTKATGAEGENLLWEPGCRYLTEGFRIANKGNLALKWKAEINKDNIVNGKVVDTAKDGVSLLDVIDFYVVTKAADGTETAVAIENFTGKLAANVGKSETYYIKGVMQTTAGNDYQDLTLEGITITVYATQDTVENDSFNNTYDAGAEYPVVISELRKTYAADASNVPDGFVVTAYHNSDFDGNSGRTGTINIKDAESLLYFAYVLDPAAALAKEPAEVWPHTSIWYGGSSARHVVLDADIDLQGITLPNGFGNMKDFDFDGKGHTIKNATINYTGSDNAGLFVGGNRGISNLVVENIRVVAPNGTENAVGIVSSNANATIDKVTVRNSSVTGGKYTGAIVGYNYGSVTNCVVESCTVSGRYKVGGVVGYICNSNDTHTYVTGNTLTDVTVKGEHLIDGKTNFVIGKIVGNWNATVGTCNNNTFSGTTVATDNIGRIESGHAVTE